jgi:hypothetical protein
VTESRGGDLRESRTQRARGIRHDARIDSESRLIGRGEMTQLMIHSTLLRRQQQQQKTQCFEHVSHSAQRLGNQVVRENANRIKHCLQLLWHRRDDGSAGRKSAKRSPANESGSEGPMDSAQAPW